MFETLTEKLELTFKRLRGHGRINEKNIEEALRDVRLALLEADVHVRVVREFLDAVKSEALGQEIMRSLTPEQHFLKIVRDELTEILGGERRELDLRGAPPLVLMLVGLQGSGKTTTVAKLARHLKQVNGRKPYLVSVDVHRPAAMEQLKILGNEIDVPVFESSSNESPVEICRTSVERARRQFHDVVLLDTAGRLHVDEALMTELQAIKDAVRPRHVLLVADAMTGQDAVQQAQGFDSRLDLTGMILTKLDGDARGGGALSMRKMVGKPILFSGVGEKLDALEPFHPDRLASRILGMGDLLSLIEKAEQSYEQKEAARLQKLAKKNQFTLEDFHEQLRQLKKMGPLGGVLELVPGARALTRNANLDQAEKELKRIEAIINSMTREERRNPSILNGSRRKRIARGSGTTVTEINRLMKQFLEMRNLMQRMHKLGPRGRFGSIPPLFQ